MLEDRKMVINCNNQQEKTERNTTKVTSVDEKKNWTGIVTDNDGNKIRVTFNRLRSLYLKEQEFCNRAKTPNEK